MSSRSCLLETRIDKPFSRWTGGRAASYVFSIYDPQRIPAYPRAVYIVVRNFNGLATPLLVAATSALPELFFHGDRYNAALKRGGNEIHVHVPAGGSCPDAIAQDLASSLFSACSGSAVIGSDIMPSFAS